MTKRRRQCCFLGGWFECVVVFVVVVADDNDGEMCCFVALLCEREFLNAMPSHVILQQYRFEYLFFFLLLFGNCHDFSFYFLILWFVGVCIPTMIKIMNNMEIFCMLFGITYTPYAHAHDVAEELRVRCLVSCICFSLETNFRKVGMWMPIADSILRSNQIQVVSRTIEEAQVTATVLPARWIKEEKYKSLTSPNDNTQWIEWKECYKLIVS